VAAGIHPEAHLKYPDPWMVFKTSTPTGEPIIRFEFVSGVAASMTCIGFIAHNLMNQGAVSGYTEIAVELGTTSTGPWNAVGTNAVISGKKGNPNLLFRFAPASGQHWRIRFIRSGGSHPAFSLGMIFLGKYYEVAKNPLINSTFHTVTSNFQARRAAGGARHRTAGAAIREERFETTFIRIPATQYEVIHWDVMGDDSPIIGIVQPENASAVMPIGGLGHFFGEIRSSNPQGTPDTADPDLYNATIIGEGCV